LETVFNSFSFQKFGVIKRDKFKSILFYSKPFRLLQLLNIEIIIVWTALLQSLIYLKKPRSLTNKLRTIADGVDINFIDPMLIVWGSGELCRHLLDRKGIFSGGGVYSRPYGAKHFGSRFDQYINSEDFSDD
jgi:hypothetical protein